jgi:hypothetical protein
MALAQQNGMQGVYLTAAELTARGFIVSLTSRNAFGADLLVTDQRCQKTWSVQVKTSGRRKDYWLGSSRAKGIKSDSHIYVFVNLKGDQRPDCLVVRSKVVAKHTAEGSTYKSGTFYLFESKNAHLPPGDEGWDVFGEPGA